MQYVSNIIRSVLVALYQSFGASVLLSILFMFAYLYAKEHGIKNTVRYWIDNFKESYLFRKIFVLSIYTSMLLFRTLLCRSMWTNPVENVLGIWGLYDSKGKLYTENIENLILFIPFIVLLIWTFQSKLFKGGIIKFKNVMLKSFVISFCFSLSIEFIQLFFKLGTFQLSDLAFNTLGGIIGGIIYYCAYKLKEKKRSKISK